MVQDLAVVPLIIFLPELGNVSEGFLELGTAVARVAIFAAGMAFFGAGLPVAYGQDQELEVARVVPDLVGGVGLGVGNGTYPFGLSFALGAFVSGMVLSRSDYSHQAFADIWLLRDVFAMLFFVSVEMLYRPGVFVGASGEHSSDRRAGFRG